MDALLRAGRAHFGHALLFSLVSNLLQLAVPLYMLQLFDRVLGSRSHETLWLLTLVTVLALVAHVGLDRLRGRLLAAAGQALEQVAGPQVLGRALQGGGGAAAPSLRDIGSVRAALSGGVLVPLFDAPWVPVYLGVIFLFHVELGVIACIGALLMVAWAVLNERATAAPLGQARAEAQAAHACADTALRQRELLVALGMRAAVLRRWAALNEAALAAGAQAEARTGLFLALTRFTRLGLQVAMLAVGAKLVIEQQVSAGVMITGTLVLSRALAPIENVLSGWRQWVEARAAWQRLQTVWREPPPADGQWTQGPGGLQVDRLTVLEGGVPVLKNVSLALRPGELLGVIGASGAGKSVLLRALCGVLVPAAGAVRWNDADLHALVQSGTRLTLGYLPQHARLLPGTIAENIARLGEVDEAAVVEAAQRARVHEMILRLPRGYQTEVQEGTPGLSAGQVQRIALARAFYGQPALLVLDEPDAHLDGDAMEQLAGALKVLRERGCTVVVATHRPTLLKPMDALVLLRDGQVQHAGPRAEVLARLSSAPLRALAHEQEKMA